MTRSCLPSLVAALAFAALPATGSAQFVEAAAGIQLRLALAQAADDGVLDGAQMFSPETVKTARDQVLKIRRQYHIAVFIETVTHVPASGSSRATSWNVRTANTYFHEWATARSQEFGVEGIHVLICKRPRKVAVVTWPERLDAQFNSKDRAGIERLLTRQLVATPDEALLSVLDQIRADLQAHTEREPPTVPFGPLGAFILGTVGLWLVLSLVRLRLQKSEPFSFTGEPQSLRLTAGLLAGMFGNPCGYWITDRLFPHERGGSVADLVLEGPPSAGPATPTEEMLHGSRTDEPGSLSERAEVKHE